jgi:hypothetical protein
MPTAPVSVHLGVVVGDQDPRRCVRCGRVPLLVLVFAGGVIQHARVGCTCFGVRLHPDETAQAMRARISREYETAVATRPAS